MKKYYAVQRGWKPGVYRTWAACQKQIIYYKNALFKAFDNYEDAEDYVAEGNYDFVVDYYDDGL